MPSLVGMITKTPFLQLFFNDSSYSSPSFDFYSFYDGAEGDVPTFFSSFNRSSDYFVLLGADGAT